MRKKRVISSMIKTERIRLIGFSLRNSKGYNKMRTSQNSICHGVSMVNRAKMTYDVLIPVPNILQFCKIL